MFKRVNPKKREVNKELKLVNLNKIKTVDNSFRPLPSFGCFSLLLFSLINIPTFMLGREEIIRRLVFDKTDKIDKHEAKLVKKRGNHK
jgi:hypothetical protein